ncbi:MAG: phosphoribosyltransferase family protein [Magnetococcales bacterium]|nr:phosphoribosyltransferase family protein [Magnetococcales bacterium]
MERAVELSTGELRVHGMVDKLELDQLCGFASRKNPNRPFLFVSRVLGRHIPATPAVMRLVCRLLVEKLPADVTGPATVIGMAETAVGLGHGVHDLWRMASGRDDLLFIHSTRYRIGAHPILAAFEETHSHATGHLLHRPASADDAALLTASRTLVLVDDEATTGATFVALATTLREEMPRLSRIVCVTITDWMGASRRQDVRTAMPVQTDFVSLLEGGYSFFPASVPPPEMPHVTGNGDHKDHLLPVNWGRLGLRQPRPLPDHVLGISARPGERILVLGTGEFVFPPFHLAERLATMGADVMVQSTTRSPILEGNAIQGTLTFPDAYADGIPNYLYSVHPGQYDRVLVCYETPPETAQNQLIATLGAEAIYFNHGTR